MLHLDLRGLSQAEKYQKLIDNNCGLQFFMLKIEEAVAALSKSIFPVVVGESEFVGTGFFVRRNGRIFGCTAAHTLDAYPSCVMQHSTGCTSFSSAVTDSAQDIAVVLISSAVNPENVCTTEMKQADSFLSYHSFAVVGHTVADWKKGRFRLRQVHGTENLSERRRESVFEPIEVCFRKNKLRGISPIKLISPDPYGLSGSPVFMYKNGLGLDVDAVPEILLAGVATDWQEQRNSIVVRSAHTLMQLIDTIP